MAGYGQGAYGSGRYGAARTTLTLNEQDVFPPRIQVVAAGLSVGDAVEITRTQAGSSDPSLVRGSVAVVADPSLVRIDAEEPFGVALTYHLLVNGAEIAHAGPITVDQAKVVLSDAINGQSAEVAVTAWPDKSRDANATVFEVGGRNIVVSGKRGQFSSTLTLFTETETARASLAALLQHATQNILQIRQPGGYAAVDGYLAVLSDTESRFSQDGSDERRTWTLNVAEVGPWAATLLALGFTYADLADAYTGLAYADLAGDYDTYLDLDQADLS